jgi:hypothetical protein
MMETISIEELDLLRTFYKLLLDQTIRSEKKIKNNSLFWTLIICNEKSRFNIMDLSAQSKHLFDISLLENLVESGFLIFNSVQIDGEFYALTPKGIWYLDKMEKGFEDDDLIKFISSKFFNFKKKGLPINDKDRLALFTMIGIRNFSLNSKMDLRDIRECNEWEKIFEISYEFLNSKGHFSKFYKSYDELVTKKSSEPPIINLMRHTNDLPIKSEHIFNNPGGKLGKTYWLDLSKDGNFIKVKFIHLLNLIFGEIKSFPEIQEINDELNLLAHNHAKLVIKDFKFIKSSYDELIYESLKKFFLKV